MWCSEVWRPRNSVSTQFFNLHWYAKVVFYFLCHTGNDDTWTTIPLSMSLSILFFSFSKYFELKKFAIQALFISSRPCVQQSSVSTSCGKCQCNLIVFQSASPSVDVPEVCLSVQGGGGVFRLFVHISVQVPGLSVCPCVLLSLFLSLSVSLSVRAP